MEGASFTSLIRPQINRLNAERWRGAASGGYSDIIATMDFVYDALHAW
jgi:hypothetical protein